MDPQNTQTQVEEVTQTSDTPSQTIPQTNPVQPGVTTTTTTVQQPPVPVEPAFQQSVSQAPPPPVETPSNSSMLIKVAIGVLVLAIVAAISFIVYANFISPKVSPTTMTQPALEVPAPETTTVETPVETLPASESAIPTEEPVVTP